jgi:hypothetical protein
MRRGCLLALGGLLGFLLLALVFGTVSKDHPAPSPPTIPAAVNPYLSLSPEKILEQGRSLDKRMKDANNPDPKRFDKLLKSGQLHLIEKKEVVQTRAALESITSGPQHPDAVRLLRSLDQREEEGRKAEETYLAKAREDDVSGRKEYANDLETSYLKKGMDVQVTVAGTKGTMLVIRYVLVSRPLVFNTLNDRKVVATWKDAGFTAVRFTDGSFRTWICDLTNLKCQ